MTGTKIPKNVAEFSKEELEAWLEPIEVVLTDCDGVLWLFNSLIEGSNDVINTLIEMGKKVYFITNNSTKTREELAKKAQLLDFNISLENMISPSYLAASYLKSLNFDKKVFLVGGTGMSRELDAFGIRHTGVGSDVMNGTLTSLIKEEFKPDPEIGAVVVGFDEHVSFPKILKAATYLDREETIFVATNTDETEPYPDSEIVVPATGSIVSAIEKCSQRKATVMGKPENFICDIFFKNEIKENSEKFLMIGDRLNTDILFGNKNNLKTLMVGTGCTKIEQVYELIEQVEQGNADEEMQQQIPDFYLPRLGDLLCKL